MRQLPAVLDEPFYDLSAAQSDVFRHRAPTLADYVPHLPAWIPHRQFVEALGFSSEGIASALEHTRDRSDVWATEFENVHSLWTFDEPEIEIDGLRFPCLETYYHSQKPSPLRRRQLGCRACLGDAPWTPGKV